jgi:hypothetical protein
VGGRSAVGGLKGGLGRPIATMLFPFADALKHSPGTRSRDYGPHRLSTDPDPSPPAPSLGRAVARPECHVLG